MRLHRTHDDCLRPSELSNAIGDKNNFHFGQSVLNLLDIAS